MLYGKLWEAKTTLMGKQWLTVDLEIASEMKIIVLK